MNAVEERGDKRVVFAVEVSVPFQQAAALAEAMTGNDNDVILAAETAIRDRIQEAQGDDFEWAEEVELSVVEEGIVKPFLAEVMGPSAGAMSTSDGLGA